MRTLGWLLAALTFGLAAGRIGLVLSDAGGPASVGGFAEPEPGVGTAFFDAVLMSSFAAVGALVATRRPENPLGWVLLGVGNAWAVLLFSERLGWHLLVTGEDPAFWLWVANWAWLFAVFPMFILVPLLFPTGKAFSKAILYLAIADAAVLLFTIAFAAGPLENYPTIENPFGVADWLIPIRDVTFPLLGLAALGSIGSLVLRFGRSTGIEREQIKWVWVAGTVLVITFAISAALEDTALAVAETIQYIGFISLPVAIAVAVLRYRLYDIDVVVNRTIVYGSLTATLALVYLASVLLIQFVVAPDSNFAIAASTLAVAGVFNPARQRIQALVDRRFYRRKYDAGQALAQFSARLRDEIELDSLVSELGEVLNETMQPAHVSLWLRPNSR